MILINYGDMSVKIPELLDLCMIVIAYSSCHGVHCVILADTEV